MKRKGSIILGFSLAMVLFVSFSLFLPSSLKDSWKEVRLPKGSTYREVINILKDNGIIKREFPLLLLGKLTMNDRKIQAGYYNLNTAMSPWDVFDVLRNGRVVEFTVTVPPGSDLRGIKSRLEKYGLIDDESFHIVYDREFLDSLSINAPSLEGYLYPDTYRFPKGIEPEDIFRMMVQRMREIFDETLRKRAEELGMTENEVLTLASIIEKEAMYDRERPLISAVFHNRFQRGMKLKADPTVLYGLDRGDRRIRYRDLRRHTPYNTYIIEGLPPGPIASPGLESIKAALYPADVDYLFFVSKNDGTHYFSRTGEEHEKAVIKYQLGGSPEEVKSNLGAQAEEQGQDEEKEDKADNPR